MTNPTGAPGYTTPVDITSWPPAEALNMGQGGTGGQVTTLPCLLMGWSVKETSGSAAGHVNLINGNDANGQLVAPVTLAAGASDTHPIDPPGVYCPTGLFADAGATAIKGVVWVVLIAAAA